MGESESGGGDSLPQRWLGAAAAAAQAVRDSIDETFSEPTPMAVAVTAVGCSVVASLTTLWLVSRRNAPPRSPAPPRAAAAAPAKGGRTWKLWGGWGQWSKQRQAGGGAGRVAVKKAGRPAAAVAAAADHHLMGLKEAAAVLPYVVSNARRRADPYDTSGRTE